jgi:predicted secreted hydrolase
MCIFDDWSLRRRHAPEALLTRIAAADFAYALEFKPTQPVLWQGDAGFSRKSADPGYASHYMSWPQLAVSGTLGIAGSRKQQVRGRAWLDHEWSSALMPDGATGWDWLGLNLDDGSALMVFRMRDARGSRDLGRRHAAGCPRRTALRAGRNRLQGAAHLAQPAHCRYLSGRAGHSGGEIAPSRCSR